MVTFYVQSLKEPVLTFKVNYMNGSWVNLYEIKSLSSDCIFTALFLNVELTIVWTFAL